MWLFKRAKKKAKKTKKSAPRKKAAKKTTKRTSVKKKVARKSAGTRTKKKTSVKKTKKVELKRHSKNPIMSPGMYPWNSMAVLNPAAVDSGGRVHLFYRAMGPDGLSRIGYASSSDGLNFNEQLPFPVFFLKNDPRRNAHYPYTTPITLEYDTALYASGGGWGGCEDPRSVCIDGRVYLTFNILNGWDMAVGIASIGEEDLLKKNWNWSRLTYLSDPKGRQKNWVLFPEKFGGKFAVFYNLDKGNPDKVHIAYTDKLDYKHLPSDEEASDPQKLPNHEVAWHDRTRSAAAPPIKTKDGWLLLYHAMEKGNHGQYKLGAMLLDLKDPEKVLCRAKRPILSPDEWYENDWKPGIIYASGAVVRKGILYVYYGGGDKHVAVASIKLTDLLSSLKERKSAKLQKVNTVPLPA